MIYVEACFMFTSNRKDPIAKNQPETDLFRLETEEINSLLEEAVQNRDSIVGFDYVTMIGKNGNIYNKFADGHIEYVPL